MANVKILVEFIIDDADVEEVYDVLPNVPLEEPKIGGKFSHILQDQLYDSATGPQLAGEYRILSIGEAS